jgi:hypothetical protein
VGGAINYVRELEQLLQSLEVQKSLKQSRERRPAAGGASCSPPFAGFFSFPQYSTAPSTTSSSGGEKCCGHDAAAADIEVTMVEGHASLKVLARRRPKQLLKLVAGLHQLRVPPLHLNVTAAVDAMVLYTFSLKVILNYTYFNKKKINTLLAKLIQRRINTNFSAPAGTTPHSSRLV